MSSEHTHKDLYCREHGVRVGGCRCMSAGKTKEWVPCPGPSCPGSEKGSSVEAGMNVGPEDTSQEVSPERLQRTIPPSTAGGPDPVEERERTFTLTEVDSAIDLEPELPGPPPPAMLEAFATMQTEMGFSDALAEYGRIAIRLTKSGIKKRLRARLTPAPEPDEEDERCEWCEALFVHFELADGDMAVHNYVAGPHGYCAICHNFKASPWHSPESETIANLRHEVAALSALLEQREQKIAIMEHALDEADREIMERALHPDTEREP